MTSHRGRLDPSSTLIVLAWIAVVAPRLVQSLTAEKYRVTVGSPIPISAPAALTDAVAMLLLGGWCVLLVVQRLRDLPVDRRRVLLLLLAPWCFLVARDLYLDVRPQTAALLYPLVVVAVWVLRPRLERLAVLGYLVGLTAVLSLAMGALLPDKGVFTSAEGQLIAPEKELLGWGILIGPFTDGNNLGQFLVLGLPAVLLVRRRMHRLAIVAVTLPALLWTSSRSSLGALGAGAAVALLLALAPHVLRRALSVLALLAAAAAMVLVPLGATSPQAFTNRGLIWRISLQEAAASPVVGLGSRWYADVAQYANSLGGTAFHGHNQFVHTLVVGGLVYVALMALLVAGLIGAAGVWAARGVGYPAAFLATLLGSCVLEVSFGVVDREFLLAVSMLPVAWIALATPDGTGSDGEHDPDQPGPDQVQHPDLLGQRGAVEPAVVGHDHHPVRPG